MKAYLHWIFIQRDTPQHYSLRVDLRGALTWALRHYEAEVLLPRVCCVISGCLVSVTELVALTEREKQLQREKLLPEIQNNKFTLEIFMTFY